MPALAWRGCSGRRAACLCGGAGQTTASICARDCEADLPRNEPACSVCAEPLPRRVQRSRVVRRMPARSAARSACSFVPFRYAYPLDHLVRGLKFRGELRVRARARPAVRALRARARRAVAGS